MADSVSDSCLELKPYFSLLCDNSLIVSSACLVTEQSAPSPEHTAELDVSDMSTVNALDQSSETKPHVSPKCLRTDIVSAGEVSMNPADPVATDDANNKLLQQTADLDSDSAGLFVTAQHLTFMCSNQKNSYF